MDSPNVLLQRRQGYKVYHPVLHEKQKQIQQMMQQRSKSIDSYLMDDQLDEQAIREILDLAEPVGDSAYDVNSFKE